LAAQVKHGHGLRDGVGENLILFHVTMVARWARAPG
jgi:hypothetical protein